MSCDARFVTTEYREQDYPEKSEFYCTACTKLGSSPAHCTAQCSGADHSTTTLQLKVWILESLCIEVPGYNLPILASASADMSADLSAEMFEMLKIFFTVCSRVLQYNSSFLRSSLFLGRSKACAPISHSFCPSVCQSVS